jgi:hypothetical protein
MLILILRIILSPICLLIDTLNVLVALLMWDRRFMNEIDDETNAINKIFTSKSNEL